MPPGVAIPATKMMISDRTNPPNKEVMACTSYSKSKSEVKRQSNGARCPSVVLPVRDLCGVRGFVQHVAFSASVPCLHRRPTCLAHVSRNQSFTRRVSLCSMEFPPRRVGSVKCGSRRGIGRGPEVVVRSLGD